ncbi:hypothetical protein HPB51_027746 [Rhipicephalus microplus]|uniref:DDE Tnp4 domain-containing protein n=1 Tax=Rhipicephalus microplus TaxID=6941 RepID=A0A9J6CZE6_RHIMP|nr:hypothetical protein HPB51_027746 [Rhipicephalus microplus]
MGLGLMVVVASQIVDAVRRQGPGGMSQVLRPLGVEAGRRRAVYGGLRAFTSDEAIMRPNSITRQLDGGYPGSNHDAGNVVKSQAYAMPEKSVQGHHYCLYDDPAYPLRPLQLKPYGGASLTPKQCAFNKAKSSVRLA